MTRYWPGRNQRAGADQYSGHRAYRDDDQGATTVYSQTIGPIAQLKMADWYGRIFRSQSRANRMLCRPICRPTQTA